MLQLLMYLLFSYTTCEWSESEFHNKSSVLFCSVQNFIQHVCKQTDYLCATSVIILLANNIAWLRLLNWKQIIIMLLIFKIGRSNLSGHVYIIFLVVLLIFKVSRNNLSDHVYVLAHLSRRLTRWAYSIPMVRRPSSSTLSYLNISEACWPILIKFYV